jgi:predicted amino acid racemase
MQTVLIYTTVMSLIGASVTVLLTKVWEDTLEGRETWVERLENKIAEVIELWHIRLSGKQ